MIGIIIALLALLGLFRVLARMRREEGWSLGLYAAVFLWFAVVGCAIWWTVDWDARYQHHRNWLTIAVSVLITIPSFIWVAKACIRYQETVNRRMEAEWTASRNSPATTGPPEMPD